MSPVSQGTTKTVPLSAYIGQDGAHSITFTGIDAAGTLVMLEDLATGTMHQVTEGYVYNFNAAQTDNPNRFMLHFSTATVTGISSTENEAVRLFPNPTAGNATVLFGENHMYNQLSVTDLSGKVIVAETVEPTENSKTIDISNFASGIYTVRLSGKNVAVQKLVKQ